MHAPVIRLLSLANEDYTTSNSNTTIHLSFIGNQSFTIEIPILGDNVLDENEIIFVQLQIDNPPTTNLVADAAEATIIVHENGTAVL